MIYKTKDLTSSQKTAIESLLGRAVSANEAISIRTVQSSDAPEWLQQSWQNAEQRQVSQLSMQEIDAKIETAGKARKSCSPTQQ